MHYVQIFVGLISNVKPWEKIKDNLKNNYFKRDMLVIFQKKKKKLDCSNFLSLSWFNVEKEHIFNSHPKCKYFNQQMFTF